MGGVPFGDLRVLDTSRENQRVLTSVFSETALYLGIQLLKL